ncbi:hypothetical protein SFRURICE_018945 [Spodoptera frugiperda]|uniref:SFRICE_022842 n=1 Tax=Spodoptera frugiperda TaxID=7108 RepID=A0A2H1V774_SPOFR|nr:hypothetical protein SFRURICE_018945 [Spodoptera frugiperda]
MAPHLHKSKFAPKPWITLMAISKGTKRAPQIDLSLSRAAPTCRRYNFREQRIDGAGLPLLTEDHLTGMLQMKLGPALKLRAVLARRLEPCVQCQAATNTLAMAPRINGAALKSEPRSNTTSPS